MSSPVLLEIANGVATVTLNRPQNGNAINMELARALMHAMHDCERDASVRVVTLSGAGKMFCTGGDLKAIESHGPGAAAYVRELLAYLHEALSAIALTVQYVKDRKAFGQRILDFQNTRFTLAEAKTESTVLRAFLERCILDFMDGKLDPATSAMLKYWASEQQNAIVDDCVQLHGGYGYILDYPIAKMWVDGRITKIYGGANEIMKNIIGRTLGGRAR